LNELFEKIASAIKAGGTITFARFMELALYCPEYGYYEREKDILGRRGDYYTSVNTGSVFGELLAAQFARWRTEAGSHGLWQIVEAGAHDGRLAADILGWLRDNCPEIFDSVEYRIGESSPRRRQWQQDTLGKLEAKVRWPGQFAPSRIGGSAESGINGVIFSNELLDAMPVHRVGWDADSREWFEWGVAMLSGEFIWQRRDRDPLNDEAIEALPKALLNVLPDGFVLEFSPRAEGWYAAAARALRRGKLLTIDYGLTSEEILSPERTSGTLRAYHQHRLTSNVLSQPGEQDITAHVNFSRLQAIGEAAGLVTEIFSWQDTFLTKIAARDLEKPWSPEKIRQFQTLTHPEHMGRKFRVLVQSRQDPL
jgi:SAM-dependent MidA family methyltransferase